MVIVRVSEALVRPGMVDEFLAVLIALVATFPAQYDGLLDHEVLVDRADRTRVRYVSRWAEEASLVAYAGEDWATTPVTFPDEDRYLTGPLELTHFNEVADI
jgi:quinol monooxygenase YgiN